MIMLSGRLVQMVEDHADQLANSVIEDLRKDPQVPAYHKLSSTEFHHRVHDVYHNLGEWLVGNGPLIEVSYSSLGKERATEGVPLSQVIYSLILTKRHLIDYVRSARSFESAVELYELQELRNLIGSFFDRAIYYTACGYERERALPRALSEVKG